MTCDIGPHYDWTTRPPNTTSRNNDTKLPSLSHTMIASIREEPNGVMTLGYGRSAHTRNGTRSLLD